MNAIIKSPLNQGQQEAAEAFFAFLFSDDVEFVLSGPGGTGKTFLMGRLIDEVLPRYYDTCKLMGTDPLYDQVEMTATTNKAAEALSRSTRRPTSTIHSFLGLKPQEDLDTGKSTIVKTRQWRVHERTILFIDEYTLIDTPLMKAILEGTHQCKIVYVGDHCQMAPVMEVQSPIDRRGLPFYQLTEPMRNNGQPALMALCQQLRNTVETGIFTPIKVVPGVIDWLNPLEMEKELTSAFAEQADDLRILAYTNKHVVTYNDFIREVRGLGDEFTVGEHLVNNNAIQLRDRMLKVEEEVEIIRQTGGVEDIKVGQFEGEDIVLKIRRTDLRSKLGEVFTDVQLPVDRTHFTDLMKYYAGKKNWERFFHLKNKYPDLRQRDAATVYKAQGSTYGTVYIDVGNISTCHNPNQVARQMYVAGSRAQNRVVLYGELAQKYGGVIH